MLARTLGSLAGVLAVGVVVWLSGTPIARSQGGAGEAVGNKDDEAAYSKSFTQRDSLVRGERKPSGPADQKLMETMAKYLIGRLAWVAGNSNEAQLAAHLAPMHDTLERELLQPLLLPTSYKGNRMFVDQLGVPLAKTFKAVLARDFADKDNRVVLINAALMLPPVAKLKQEAMGDLLVEIINDPKQHDAVKVYAVKALREFFPAHMLSIGANLKDPQFKRDNERLAALVSFIDRKGPVPADPGERDAIRYMRREAIMSLGRIGVPALAALKKKGVVDGPAAYELLRVLVKGKGAYVPPTSLSERVEAAIGLAHLSDPNGDVDYDPSVAVYAVGLCYLDFATAYSADYINFSGRKDPNNPAPKSKLPTLPWRIAAERFRLAGKELVSAAKGTPARAGALKLEKEINQIGDLMRNYIILQPTNVDALREVVKSLVPKSDKLYKLNGPKVDPASLQAGPAETIE